MKGERHGIQPIPFSTVRGSALNNQGPLMSGFTWLQLRGTKRGQREVYNSQVKYL